MLQRKQLLDSVRSEHSSFIATEERLRTERVQSARSDSRLVTVTCILLSLGIGVFLAIFTRGRLHALAAQFKKSLDVAEQHSAALRESEEQFRTLANAIPQLCWMANADGWIFWYNRRWYDYTGTTPQQMEGWGWQSVHDPEALPKVLERWQASIATGQPFEMVFPCAAPTAYFAPS